jgi:SAM-dependent methyltransferase
MRELSKSIPRRLRDPNFMRRYFVGNGVDIGGKPDPLSLYSEFFPLMGEVKVWDLEDGDAQFMESVPDNTFDFVNSSHCLEHLRDPAEGLRSWLRIVRPGGYIIGIVPDEDLYEQGIFPSTKNLDHKHTFTIYKGKSWSPNSINLMTVFSELGPHLRVERIELLDSTFRYDLPRYDQTMTPVGECAIEFVLRKAPLEEVERGGLDWVRPQPAAGLRIHFNQYRDDYKNMKQSNSSRPPFTNDEEL